MDWLEALILGIVQGLTEFLPVSSSGHLLLGKEILGINTEAGGTTFEVVVHAATVLSTIFVFRKDLAQLLGGFFKFKYNDETQYLLKIAVSMIPVMIVGFFFKDTVKLLFGQGPLLIGCMLLITASLLLLTHFKKSGTRKIGYRDAFIIGLAQAVAVFPGLSRSGSTISTGLLLGNDKNEIARFSFLMVLVPILGEAFLELIGGEFSPAASNIPTMSLIVGFLAAFIAGLFACKVMISIVKRMKLYWFALYCGIVGVIAIIYSLI